MLFLFCFLFRNFWRKLCFQHWRGSCVCESIKPSRFASEPMKSTILTKGKTCRIYSKPCLKIWTAASDWHFVVHKAHVGPALTCNSCESFWKQLKICHRVHNPIIKSIQLLAENLWNEHLFLHTAAFYSELCQTYKQNEPNKHIPSWTPISDALWTVNDQGAVRKVVYWDIPRWKQS